MAEEKIKSLDEDINALLLSPIYNMSMCTLENFHTEFWKWLGNTYPHEFIKAITGKYYSEIPPEKIEFKSQAKINENSILDLLIKIDENGDDEEYIIIENKIKSYPNNDQLDKYAEYYKGKKATFILTSLSPALHLQKNWNYVSYKDISNGLKKEFNSDFKYKSDYHKLLIKDYINVITTLYNIFSPENTERKYDFYYEIGEKDKEISPDKIKLHKRHKRLEEIYLDDIYKKFRTAELAKYIEDHITEEGYYADNSFHNKKGTIDIGNGGKGFPEYKGSNDEDCWGKFDVRIQIEGNQYRYCLLGLCEDDGDHANEIREKICNELMEKGLWFNHDKIKKTTRTKIYNSFCGYRGGFIYRYFPLKECFNPNLEDISYDSIAKQVKADLVKLKNNTAQINQIIMDELKRNKYIVK